MPEWLRFVLAALATWRISHLLAREDGPWEVIAILREKAGDGVAGKLLDCFYCLSLWVAIPFAFFVSADWAERAVAWLAISGAAILLERRSPDEQPMIMEVRNDELLRPAPASGEKRQPADLDAARGGVRDRVSGG